MMSGGIHKDSKNYKEPEEVIGRPFWFYEGKETPINFGDDYMTFVWVETLPEGEYRSIEELKEEVILNTRQVMAYMVATSILKKEYPELIVDEGSLTIGNEKIRYVTIKNPEKVYRFFSPGTLLYNLIKYMQVGILPENEKEELLVSLQDLKDILEQKIPEEYLFKSDEELIKRLWYLTKDQSFYVFVNKKGEEVIIGNEEELKKAGCTWERLDKILERKQEKIRFEIMFSKFRSIFKK